MSVQTSYRLYQNDKGVGIIAENNPYDIGAYIVGADGIDWGVFVIGTAGSRDIIPATAITATTYIVGATTKQTDRVDGQFLGISKDTASNASLSFSLSQGRPASVMRMGYLNMRIANGAAWEQAKPVFVKITKGTGTDDGAPLGATGISAGAAGTGVYVALAGASFADSSVGSSATNVAKVFFDTRSPVFASASK